MCSVTFEIIRIIWSTRSNENNIEIENKTKSIRMDDDSSSEIDIVSFLASSDSDDEYELHDEKQHPKNINSEKCSEQV